jgi:hypothetical protein
VGVGAVFETTNGAGAAALLAVGAALVAVALVWDRVERLELAGNVITLSKAIQETLDFAATFDQSDPDRAVRLRGAARQLRKFGQYYRAIRERMPGGPERTRVMDTLMGDVAELGGTGVFEPEHVVRWFEQGTEEARITSIGLMQGAAGLRDLDIAMDAIENSRSAFEQYHGLRLAEMIIADRQLTTIERKLLDLAVRVSWRALASGTTPRRRLRQRGSWSCSTARSLAWGSKPRLQSG